MSKAAAAREAVIRWEQRQAKERERSQRRRDASKVLCRPNPSAVDRAIVEAMKDVWRQNTMAAGEEATAQREASKDPISPWKVAEKALEILVTHKRADPRQAGKMVMDRLRPRDPDVIRVRRSDLYPAAGNAMSADVDRDGDHGRHLNK